MPRDRLRTPPLAVLIGSAAFACAGAPDPQTPSPPVASIGVAPSAEPAPPEPSSPTCGEIDCQLFDTPSQAFAAILTTKPLIVAIGESHAQRGTEHLKSATARFTETLLPTFQGQASDLVLELLSGKPECREQEAEVAEKQKPVTETQAETNQNEYVLMGHACQGLGITPHILRPSCEDYNAILDAGDSTVDVMLRTIARLTGVMVQAILERNQREGAAERIIVTYGGLVHNDIEPREGREPWSFGPQLHQLSGGRYVEVDLIVPEYIKDGPPWTSLRWVPSFDKTRHADRVRLLNPSPGTYVLVFAQS